jgi:CheY-like chemotaxis protein
MPKGAPNPTPAKGLRVLVIDDEKNIRTTLGLCLEQIGCEVTAVASAEGALEALARQRHDLAFLDLRLGGSSGLDLIPRLLADVPDVMVVIMTAYATIDSAVEAIKRGAADYIAKPFTPAQIRHVVEQCLTRRDLTRQIHDLELRLSEAAPDIDLESASPKVRSVIDIAVKASASDVARARHTHLSSLIVPRFPKNSWPVSFSATPKELSPEPYETRPGAWRRRKEAHYSLTKSARFLRRCKQSCYVSWKKKNTNGWAKTARGAPMFE